MTNLTLQENVCVNFKDSSLEYKTVCGVLDARLKNMRLPNAFPQTLICSEIEVDCE